MMTIRSAFLIVMILLLPNMTTSRVGAAMPPLEFVNLTNYSVWVTAERNAERIAITVAPQGKAPFAQAGTFSFTAGLTVNGKKIELPRKNVVVTGTDRQSLTIWKSGGSFYWDFRSSASGGFQ
jgi:hypothetical protein